jgi:hypothetical protein
MGFWENLQAARRRTFYVCSRREPLEKKKEKK